MTREESNNKYLRWLNNIWFEVQINNKEYNTGLIRDMRPEGLGKFRSSLIHDNYTPSESAPTMEDVAKVKEAINAYLNGKRKGAHGKSNKNIVDKYDYVLLQVLRRFGNVYHGGGGNRFRLIKVEAFFLMWEQITFLNSLGYEWEYVNDTPPSDERHNCIFIKIPIND